MVRENLLGSWPRGIGDSSKLSSELLYFLHRPSLCPDPGFSSGDSDPSACSSSQYLTVSNGRMKLIWGMMSLQMKKRAVEDHPVIQKIVFLLPEAERVHLNLLAFQEQFNFTAF